jgi:hypothetical protein
MDRTKPVGLFYNVAFKAENLLYLLQVKCRNCIHWIFARMSTQFLLR